MRTLSFLLAATFVFAPAVCFAGGQGAGQSMPSAPVGFDVANLDRSVGPCEDFNKFANGGWIAKNPIPPQYPAWGTPGIMRERNIAQLRSILEAAMKASPARGSNEQKIGDYYYSVQDTKTRDAEGVKPLGPWLARIDAAKDAKGVQDAFAYLVAYGVDSPFGIGAVPDFKNSRQNIAYVGQGGLGLPDRDYYVKDDERSKTIREAYVRHVAKTLELLGEDAQKAAAGAKIVMEIETRLANASLTNVELRDPSQSYHVMTAAERKALMPNFDWDRYLAAVGLKGTTAVNVAHPKFFTELNAMLAEVPVESWKVYLRWRLLNDVSSTLSTPFEQADFDFYNGVLRGTTVMQPLWMRAVTATSSRLGEALGQLYVKQYFPPESKKRIEALIANLRAALRDDIRQLDWMGDTTRKEALAKLDALGQKIGFPDAWVDYSKLDVDRGPYVMNVMRARRWAFDRDIAKVDKPVDRTEWLAPPQTINAGYFPLNNEIFFPAAILQPPLFDPAADDALNYGAIGAVIGHELTHGFDDQGAQFDAEGNLRRWWTPEDYSKFEARTACLEKQFDAYTLEDGTRVKGKLVKGEAIADLGGLKIAWLAYQKSLEGKTRPADIDGFTPEQRFFLGFGQAWKANARPQYEQFQSNTDPHPLPRFRLNGTVVNMPEFYKAFGCGEGAKMVRAADRCQIW
jgi:putative endopeptidase